MQDKLEARVRANPRLDNAVLGLRHLDHDERARVQAVGFLRVMEDR